MQTTLSSREFNQDTGRAKRAAKEGPVFITDRGQTSHVLLSIDEYRKLAFKGKNLAEALAHPASAHIEFDLPGVRDFTLKIPDFE